MENRFPRRQPAKIHINWAKECAIGAVISAVFTVMAINSGTDGVVSASVTAHLHDAMIIGGITMSMVCGYATLVIVLGRMLDTAKQNFAPVGGGMAKTARLLGTMQTVRFLKIFLP